MSLDPKHSNLFLIQTDRDISFLGATTKQKYCSYNMEISPWNLIDLFSNKAKYGLEIDYDPTIEPIIQRLRDEVQVYKDAKKYRTMSEEELDAIWDAEGFEALFPKLQADQFQKRVILWSLAVKRGGCYLEQGLGKTIVGIILLGKLMADGLIEKPLIVAPVSLLSDTAWFKDLASFSEFEPINLRDPEDFYNPTGHINFINPDKFQHWCFRKTKDAEHSYNKDNYFEMRRFDAVFFDESSVLKTHSSYRTRAFIELSKYFKYIFMASGTPAPNKIFQIWGQMRALGSILGDNYSPFEMRYGVKRKVGPTELWFPAVNAEMDIRKRIDLATYWVKRDSVMKLPKRFFVDREITLHEDHFKLYEKVEKDYIAAVVGLDNIGDETAGEIAIEHEVTLRLKLLQIIDGFTDVEDKEGKKTRVSLPWNAKLEQLDSDIAEYLTNPDQNIIIWCRFRFEVETIYKRYKEKYTCTYIYGGMGDKKREASLKLWFTPECRIIIGIAKAAKFGHTWLKATHMIYYSGTEDYEDYAQSHDRNYRRGQTKEVTEIRYIARKTVERKVWYAIQTRKKLDKFLKDYYRGMKHEQDGVSA